MEQKIRDAAADSGSMAAPEWLMNEAAARMRDGRLPQEVPHSIFAGPGRRQCCALCDYAVEPGELAYQVALVEEKEAPLHFHVACFRAWETTANAAPSRAPGWASGVTVQR